MKVAATLAVLGALASSVTAFVNPTDPWSTSIWKPNTKVTIQWTEDAKAPSLKTNPLVNIYFMTGSDLVQTQLAVVAENYNALTNSSIVYDVPVVDPPGQIYFLKFVSAGGQAAEPAFTTRFTVTDAAGNAGTLKPTGSPNPGGNGTIVSQPATGSTPTGAVPSASGAAGSGSTASPTGNPKNANGAGSLGASMAVAAAAVLGAAALVAF
ncbi:hypothetical protein BGZ70_002309 [Mortierella alpina]|uniref:Yeast cell wall synthesis Kre9/Knh1-like N-terminal domain-containing protein n=1 Tax=Mortierella alpina TaxID=64518 RepID=A0A9P6IUQ0_MORAP|nr:hypothetical protein BGZ70_002309 [Mortierella alpina]